MASSAGGARPEVRDEALRRRVGQVPLGQRHGGGLGVRFAAQRGAEQEHGTCSVVVVSLFCTFVLRAASCGLRSLTCPHFRAYVHVQVKQHMKRRPKGAVKAERPSRAVVSLV